jgi:SAM-dependent methyltransferase
MKEELRRETEGLTRAWAHLDPGWLGSYLVSGVEDPRLNAQSMLTRHFLIAQRWGNAFSRLRREEQRFGAVMRWWLTLDVEDEDEEMRKSIGHALRTGRDNAEGLALPAFVRRAFQELPIEADDIQVPNYLEYLCQQEMGTEGVWDTFADLWRGALSDASAAVLRVLEPACGSANDYRFLERYGLARFLDYTGVDLSESNIANARQLARDGKFEVGNVFGLGYEDLSFQVVYVHDLFEHLSILGLEQAAAEICRVARQTIAVGLFSMHEGEEHLTRVVGDYHCNTLSLPRTRALFERHGFSGQVIHLSTLLEWELGCGPYHNPNAYTLLLTRVG